jgi:hypothetical protein
VEATKLHQSASLLMAAQDRNFMNILSTEVSSEVLRSCVSFNNKANFKKMNYNLGKLKEKR